MDNTKTLTLLAIVALFLCGWFVTAQTSDEDTPDMQSQCSWEFKHDPVTSAGAGGGGGGGGGGSNSYGRDPASPVLPQTIWAKGEDGYYYDGCNGTLYRVVHDSETGVATAHKVSLED